MTISIDQYNAALDALHDGIYFVDGSRRIIAWNRRLEGLTGYRAEEAIGKRCRDIFRHVDDQGVNLCRGLCPLEKTGSERRRQDAEVYLHHKDGHLVATSMRSAPLADESDTMVIALEAISGRQPRFNVRDKLEQLKKLDLCDPLTGLANRRYITLSISSRLEEMHRYGWTFGILFVDIDNFRLFNEQWGWESGNRALNMIASALLNSARSFDMVGRWGGEEFVAILGNVNEEQLLNIAERLRGVVEETMIPANGKEIKVTVSVGITMTRPEDTLESMMKRADTLIELCQHGGHNTVVASWDLLEGAMLREVV